MNSLSIGQLSKRTECKVPTIRYYEDIGLIPTPLRSAGNQRRYGERHEQRLKFIRHARALGFALDDIRELVQLANEPASCPKVDDLAAKHLQQVTEKLEKLQRLKEELTVLVNQCDHQPQSPCRVIEVLSDHDLCHSDHH